jgi:hypothetical protein
MSVLVRTPSRDGICGARNFPTSSYVRSVKSQYSHEQDEVIQERDKQFI